MALFEAALEEDDCDPRLSIITVVAVEDGDVKGGLTNRRVLGAGSAYSCVFVSVSEDDIADEA